jgi:hypothetical protein
MIFYDLLFPEFLRGFVIKRKIGHSLMKWYYSHIFVLLITF